MFAKATRSFVEEVDPGGTLIPASTLNDKVTILTVVIKKKKGQLMWQKPKYTATDFTLNDILVGNKAIEPVITKKEFLKYSGKQKDRVSAKVDASVFQHGINMEGRDSSHLQFWFGNVKKEELDVRHLLKVSKERSLDMSHSLVGQTMMNQKKVIGIVKERIVTTQPSYVLEDKSGEFKSQLALTASGSKKASVKQDTTVGKDSNVAMEIPAHTTLAYTLLELEVKQDGKFGLCLLAGASGGFEEVEAQEKKKIASI